MRTSGVAFMGVCCFFAGALSAAEKIWTGGAGDGLFSSANNWNPSGQPANGDALIFSPGSAVNVTNDLTGYAFSGITQSGSAAVTLGGGNGFTLTGGITVSGARELNICVPITVTNAVALTLSGANFYAYGPISGAGSFTLVGGNSFYAKDAVTLSGGVIANKGKVYIEKTTFTAPVVLNQYLSNGVSYTSLTFVNSGTYAVPVTVSNADGYANGGTLGTPGGVAVTNTAAITIAPSAYTRWQPNGSMTFAGGITLQNPVVSGDMSVIFNGNTIIRQVPLAFTNCVYVDSGTFRFAVAGNTYAGLKCFTKTVYTDVPYALDPSRTVSFGVSYSQSGALDLNGNDQIINRPVIDNWNNIGASSYILTSSSGAAKLACRATGSATFFGSLNGALSLSWEPTSNDYTCALTGRTSQTTGSLLVNAGTLCLAAGTSFPNLTSLVATNTGVLRVETTGVNPGAGLTLAGSAQLSLPEGLGLTCLTASVDGNALTAGVYTASDTAAGRAFITGEGTLRVLSVPLSGAVRTWTGAGADNRFSTVGNWDSAPAFDGSETLLFSADGSTGVVDGVVRAGALRFNRGTPFTLLPSDASSALRLGLGGVTTLSPVAGTPVTNALAVPLDMAYACEMQIATNHQFAISATLSGGLPTAPLIKTGAGTLRMTGTNTFESPLIISNGFVNVNNGTALGNPTNAITIQCNVPTADSWNRRGPIYFTDTVVTNSRPIIVGTAGNYLGQVYPQNGTLVLNGKFTFAGGGRIDNQGTLIFRGGFDSTAATPWMQTQSGNVTRFENQPLNFAGNSISLDNYGTFAVSVTNNIWASVGLLKGTFLCGAANVLPTNSFVTFGVSYAPQGFLDLNGFDQQVKFLNYNTYSGTMVTNMQIRSVSPATLTLQGDSSTRPFIGYFSGKVSLRHRNTGTFALTTPKSSSTTAGDLLVEAGTVSFAQGATWTGSTNITVTAGTLSVDGGAGATFGGSDVKVNVTRLHLSSASHVNLAAGVTDYVYALTVDGKRQPIGSYGSSSSAAQYKSALFTGTGVLYALRSEGAGTLISVR